MLTDLSGQIEKITYINEESGYTVARVKVRGRQELVTVVGNLLAAAPGEVVEMQGQWSRHPRFGEQFKVVRLKTKVPATVYGIRRYLGSGLIKGLGPVMAGRIVEKFGAQTLEVIEEDIGRLAEVEGIGKKRIAMIGRTWEAQKEIRDVMLFLQSQGISSGFAARIFKQYGQRSIAVVKENPYRLATDIIGIGFLTADRIAAQLGFSKDCAVRVEAGILYVLHQLSDEGHVYFPYARLVAKCSQILTVNRQAVVRALGVLAQQERIVVEDLDPTAGAAPENNQAVYLAKFHLCETALARRLKMLLDAPRALRAIDTRRALAWVQQKLAFKLAVKQQTALRAALENKLLVITGGPGTGKTTVITAVLKIFARMGAKMLLAAPTGRAARRMREATGHNARTIHRLLEYNLQKGGFQRNEQNPLDCQVLIVDEASMIDTILMYHLLKAVPAAASFILVGDVNQLPSVGPGAVLNDIIGSGVVPVVAFTEIFRQARTSRIIVNAHKINAGIVPSMAAEDAADPHNDFYFIDQDKPERVLAIILELVKDRIPKRFGFDAFDDIQVLTPMHRGVVGAGNLNRSLQAVLNPGKEGVSRADQVYRLHDKVMQIRNNYAKEVFNGDIGRITLLRPAARQVTVTFDGRPVAYDFSELDEIVLAYAVSVHKSQGSEYPAVVFPVLTQHYILLQRNLIYTAVTRGRSLVVMVGSRRALAIGVNNNKTRRRFTCLEHRLKAL